MRTHLAPLLLVVLFLASCASSQAAAQTAAKSAPAAARPTAAAQPAVPATATAGQSAQPVSPATPPPPAIQSTPDVPTATLPATAQPAPQVADAPAATPTAAPTAVDPRWQSGRVPEGFPTPNTVGELLQAGGPARDPGSLAWAHPGPYIGDAIKGAAFHSFTSAQRLMTTYYFYWDDYTTPQSEERGFLHIFDTPVDWQTYNFLSPDTHLKAFTDMAAAGLDFVLPVYWGEPGHPGRTTSETYPHYWSTEGIPPMVQALNQLHASGQPLQMGMFYDTTIIANADLTTPNGKQYFYVNIRDYYSRIPPEDWAMIDNRPIVFLYDTLWVSKFDQSTFDYASDQFAKDFNGMRPYFVIESQWAHSKGVTPPQPIHADGMYGWGAAVSGYNPDPALTVKEVGPGFNNTPYCKGGPAKNCFDINRQNGGFLEGQLKQAVATNAHIIAVETWNEFSEGTDIADTVQYGRTYINLTRKYADIFKAHS